MKVREKSIRVSIDHKPAYTLEDDEKAEEKSPERNLTTRSGWQVKPVKFINI